MQEKKRRPPPFFLQRYAENGAEPSVCKADRKESLLLIFQEVQPC